MSSDWLQDLSELAARESSYNPGASNPSSSAKGMFQFLNGTRNNKAYNKGITDWSDPVQQSVAAIRYVKSRYKTPADALKHWDEEGWY